MNKMIQIIIGACLLSSFYGLIQISDHCGGIGNLCAQLAHRFSSSSAQSAQALYQAQEQKNPDQFFSILKQAAAMPNDQFTQFLNTRNVDGWTALNVAAIYDDVVQVTALFQALNIGFKDDKQAMVDYLNQRNPDGYTAFILCCYSGNRSIVTTFFDNAVATFKNDPNLLLQVLNAAETSKGISGIHFLAFDSAFEPIEHILTTLEDLWGKESKEFYKFINKTDKNGLTALHYNRLPRGKHLLIQHGAIVSKKRRPGTIKAEKENQNLIDAMHDNNLEKMIGILHRAKENFNKQEYIHFMTTQDKQGWVPIMHPTGQNRIKFVEILLSEIYENLKENPYDFYDVIAAMGFTGRTTISVAAERRNFEIAHLLLEKSFNLPINKYLLYDYIVTQETQRGFAVLTIAIYNSSDEDIYIGFVTKLLEGMAQHFGKESRAFYLFVNQLDYNNFTAFDYANTPKMKDLLMKYGAELGSVVFARQEQNLKKVESI